MHATFRWYSDQELADRLAARADDIRAAIGPVAGLRAYYLVRTDNGTVSVTIADDQAGTEESNRVAANWIRENMPDAASSPPAISGGEVVISV
jgi:poly(3-hydroxybutyrate) depolymerase